MTTDLQDTLMGIVPGPIWPSDCDPSQYIASYEVTYSAGNREAGTLCVETVRADLYIWGGQPDKNHCPQSYLLQIGEYDYHSGDLLWLLECKKYRPWKTAVDILLSRGRIVWQPAKP